MLSRTVKLLSVAAVALLTVAATASAAARPHNPKSTNGHPVRLVASGIPTPAAIAFGAGTVFIADGGNTEESGPPNGGVWAVQNGKPRKPQARCSPPALSGTRARCTSAAAR